MKQGMMRIILPQVAFVVLLHAGCRGETEDTIGKGPSSPSAQKAPDEAQTRKPADLQVGTNEFFKDDIRIREKIISVKYGQAEDSTLGAYAQLIQGYLYVETLKAIKQPITEKDLDEEIARIDRQTKAPELLQEIKRICGDEKSNAYRKIFVLPDFANSRYNYAVFPKLEIHAERRKEAEKILARALRGEEDMDKLPGRDKRWLKTKSLFNVKYGMIPYEKELHRSPLPEGAGKENKETEKAFSKLQPGQILPRVFEKETCFLIQRFVGFEERSVREDTERFRVIENFALKKKGAEEYFWEMASTIPVKIDDEDIRKRFKERISWSKMIRLLE